MGDVRNRAAQAAANRAGGVTANIPGPTAYTPPPVNSRPDDSPERPAEPDDEAIQPASTAFSYLLYLCIGWFGAHHFHLGRDSHAFLWLTTFGGFGVGLMRDFWMLWTYVDDYNENPYYMAQLQHKASGGKRPWTFFRLVGQYTVGWWYGKVAQSLLPESLVALVPLPSAELAIYNACACAGVAAGVYLVGTLGREEGSYLHAFVGAAFGQLVTIYDPKSDSVYQLSNYTLLFSMAGFMYAWRWGDCGTAGPHSPPAYIGAGGTVNRVAGVRRSRRRRRPTSCCCSTQAVGVLLAAMLFWAGAVWAVYEHGNMNTVDKITGEHETVRFREVIDNFLNSPAVQEFWRTCGELWEKFNKNDFEQFWREFMEQLDLDGEAGSCRILELEDDELQSCKDGTLDFKVIEKKKRKMAIKFHPDKNKELSEEEATAKMAEINGAFEKLEKIYKKRQGRGKNTDPDPDPATASQKRKGKSRSKGRQ